MNLWTMPQRVEPTVIVRVLIWLPYAIDEFEEGMVCRVTIKNVNELLHLWHG